MLPKFYNIEKPNKIFSSSGSYKYILYIMCYIKSFLCYIRDAKISIFSEIYAFR